MGIVPLNECDNSTDIISGCADEQLRGSKGSLKKDVFMQEIKPSSNSHSFCEKHQNDASLCDCLPPVLDEMAPDCFQMIGYNENSNLTLNQYLNEFSSTDTTIEIDQQNFNQYLNNETLSTNQKNCLHQPSFHSMGQSSNEVHTNISPYTYDMKTSFFQTHNPEEIYSSLIPVCTTKLENTNQLQSFDYSTCAEVIKSTEFCNCPGRFDFTLKKFINDPTKPITKSIPFTYSQALDKIFYKVGVEVPIVFKFSKVIPASAKIFITIMFKNKEHKHQRVHRCAVHVDHKSIHPERFMTLKRDDNPSNYDCFHKGHDSVNFEVGAASRDGQLVVMGEFHCLNSCVSGYRRRDLVMLCQLYYHGEIVGTSFCDIHVSTSPGRDRKTKEEKALKLCNHKSKPCPSNCCKEEKQYIPLFHGKTEDKKNLYKIEIKRKHLQTVMNFVHGMAGVQVDKIEKSEN